MQKYTYWYNCWCCTWAKSHSNTASSPIILCVTLIDLGCVSTASKTTAHKRMIKKKKRKCWCRRLMAQSVEDTAAAWHILWKYISFFIMSFFVEWLWVFRAQDVDINFIATDISVYLQFCCKVYISPTDYMDQLLKTNKVTNKQECLQKSPKSATLFVVCMQSDGKS